MRIEKMAVVTSTSADLEGEAVIVASYLTVNYEVLGILPERKAILIGGYDRAGWTLRDYVIPRLASGLRGVQEVTI